MSKQIKTIIANANKAIDVAFSYAGMLAQHREAAKGMTREAFKEALRETFAARFGCTTATKKTGRIVMQGDKTAVNNATQALKRYTDDIYGKEASNREEKTELEVPEHIQALADKLAKACAEYEESRKLAATAVAQAFAA